MNGFTDPRPDHQDELFRRPGARPEAPTNVPPGRGAGAPDFEPTPSRWPRSTLALGIVRDALRGSGGPLSDEVRARVAAFDAAYLRLLADLGRWRRSQSAKKVDTKAVDREADGG